MAHTRQSGPYFGLDLSHCFSQESLKSCGRGGGGGAGRAQARQPFQRGQQGNVQRFRGGLVFKAHRPNPMGIDLQSRNIDETPEARQPLQRGQQGLLPATLNSGDTTPSRMTGVTLHSHVRCTEYRSRNIDETPEAREPLQRGQ